MKTNNPSQTKWQTKRKNGRKTNVERVRLQKLAFDLLQSGLTQKETAKRIGTCKETIRIWAKQSIERIAVNPQIPHSVEHQSNVADLLKNRFMKMLENEKTSLSDLVTMNELVKEHEKALFK